MEVGVEGMMGRRRVKKRIRKRMKEKRRISLHSRN